MLVPWKEKSPLKNYNCSFFAVLFVFDAGKQNMKNTPAM